jgi:hypothetical protein
MGGLSKSNLGIGYGSNPVLPPFYSAAMVFSRVIASSAIAAE